jgi:L,D-transpeptidase catalytic domain
MGARRTPALAAIGLTLLVSMSGVAVAPAAPSAHHRSSTPTVSPTRELPLGAVPHARAESRLLGRTGGAAPWKAAVGVGAPRAVLVWISTPIPITARPGGGRTLGVMPASSRYLGTPTVAWVTEPSPDGRFGRVRVPYSAARLSGWIPLVGLRADSTAIKLVADLSRRSLSLLRDGRVEARFVAAIGAPATPTPAGLYFVTDLIRVPRGGPYGTFAVGLSGVQQGLPPSWRGGDQLAIHGTNNPGSIGRAVSHGCLRVSNMALAMLRSVLTLGTPVIVRP